MRQKNFQFGGPLGDSQCWSFFAKTQYPPYMGNLNKSHTPSCSLQGELWTFLNALWPQTHPSWLKMQICCPGCPAFIIHFTAFVSRYYLFRIIPSIQPWSKIYPTTILSGTLVQRSGLCQK